ncbi:MAG: hypothetical protein F6K11_37000 [Leptolyngbya sp. SIO3F4]|nr:hypothetical protein [Leptolyngbya sp. SIO3F4]
MLLPVLTFGLLFFTLTKQFLGASNNVVDHVPEEMATEEQLPIVLERESSDSSVKLIIKLNPEKKSD